MRVLFFLLVVAFGCQKDGQRAPVPHFITIDEIKVQAGLPAVDISHQVSEVWVYADSNLLGAFPIPARVPVIPADQQIDLEVFAGIRENGQANSPIIYPFYTSSLFKASSSQNASTFEPQFKYLPSAKFVLEENFEVGNVLREDLDGDDETRVDVASHPGLDGRVGAMKVNSIHTNLEVASAFTLNQIPTNGSAVFLEIDYISDVSFAVGLRGSGTGTTAVNSYKLVLFPTADRTKVYVNFTPDIQTSNFNRFQIIFQTIFDTNSSLDTQYVYLDNIKVLHF